jgi:hypothetical protein
MLFAFAAPVVAQASPPPPASPPQPAAARAAALFDVCRDRSSLLFERSYAFQNRPCTIVAGPAGRKLQIESTSGPSSLKDANGKQLRPTKVVLRSFVPGARGTDSMVAIKPTGRMLRVRLPKRLPSVLNPYVITLPHDICRENYWLVSVLISDGTETKPFGVINSMCGPNAPRQP